MNRIAICSLTGIFFALTLLSLARAAEEKPLGKTASDWPGVDFEIVRVVRVEPQRLLMVVRVHAGEKAANPTFLGFRSPTVPGGETLPPRPFTLKEAVLADLATEQKYPALVDLPASPFFGPNAVMTTMRPGDWLDMAVQFPAPPAPVPDGSGKTPAQKISVTIPHAKLPVNDLVLPPPSTP